MITSSNLTIVARIESNPDQIPLVRAELRKLLEPTLKEAGSIQYDLHQDNDNPAVFLFYQNRESRELWQNHMNNSHIADYGRTTVGVIKSFAVNEMTRC